jgi:hypothetical protein
VGGNRQMGGTGESRRHLLAIGDEQISGGIVESH